MEQQYTIRMENFEGPLDLLCHLIEKNKMDICDIKIVEITDQYMEYLKQMEKMNLEVTSEFIVMASRLIYLKSKSLLPSIVEEQEEGEFDLVKLLMEYKRYKEQTFSLKDRLEQYYKRCYKLPEKVELPKGKLETQYENYIMPQIYNEFYYREKQKQNIQAENIKKLAVGEKVTIKSKIKEILKELWKKPTFIFNKLFNPKKRTKVEVVTAFLSLLELSKMSRIQVVQDKLFGDINVTKIKREK